MWAWEQGRQDYCDFDVIRKTAQVFVTMSGTRLSNTDPLRTPLTTATGLLYAPPNKPGYPVQRNYKRVFKQLLLAGFKNDILQATDVSHRLTSAQSPWSVDDYLAFLIPRFYVPFVSQKHYNHTAQVVYPMCALLRYLLVNGSATLDEIFGKIVKNRLIGNEPANNYQNLSDTGYRGLGDEVRQVREMVDFFSQAGWLDWNNDEATLLLGPSPSTMTAYLWSVASPIVGGRLADSDDEVIRLGSLVSIPQPASLAAGTGQGTQPAAAGTGQGTQPAAAGTGQGTQPPQMPTDGFDAAEDREFTEGNKKRVEHLRAERSEKLKRAYLKAKGAPTQCDVCEVKPTERYPWLGVANLQLHHKLPLSSSAHSLMTTLDDLVALCAGCHSAVHLFYRKFLNVKGQEDFVDKNEAHRAYEEAKAQYVRVPN